MRVETQLSVFLENKAGVLAAVASDLARHGISIRALTIATLADHAVVRLVVSEPRKALHLIGERGVLAVPSQVLAVELSDDTGTLAALARTLARADVNIEYAYGSSPAGTGRPVVYLHPSDFKRARAALLPRARRGRRAKPRAR